MAILTVGVDLAKNVFALHGVNGVGTVELRRPTVARSKLVALVACHATSTFVLRHKRPWLKAAAFAGLAGMPAMMSLMEPGAALASAMAGLTLALIDMFAGRRERRSDYRESPTR